jgi:hypothetical protein
VPCTGCERRDPSCKLRLRAAPNFHTASSCRARRRSA